MRSDRDSYPMLSVEEAQEQVLAQVRPLEAESMPILEALGRVLAEDIASDMDVPPLDNSAMDGYAVRAADILSASRESPVALCVVADLAAGRVLEQAMGAGEAARIMTGAPVPPGADAVVPFEDARREGNQVEILEALPKGRNVRRAGEDVRKGDIVLRVGAVLRPQEIGMLASVGRREVRVIRRPRVAILATGDEVVEPGEEVGSGKIRNINSYTNAAQVLKYGGLPLLLGVARDRTDELTGKIRQGLDAGADLFLTSGGVSVGDFDLVKKVLAAEGRINFWWVNMKPGKPMAFGTIRGVPLLGLPGNPVAAMISFELFARPMILKMRGYTCWEWPSTTARLREAIERKDGRRHYLRVRLFQGGGGLEAELTGDQGSGILTSMVAAQGLAVIPEDVRHLPAGRSVQVLLLG